MQGKAQPIVLAGVLVSAAAATLAIALGAAPRAIELKTLSTDPDHVTGGDVLVQLSAPAGTPRSALRVTLGGRDVSDSFQASAGEATFVALVTGLVNGKNTLVASAGTQSTTLEITNYPITGPVLSGPWIKPFICQTDKFKLPDGSTLGAPLDENCSAKTIVQYVYRTNEEKPVFKPLPSGGALPSDLARTTTTEGKTVNFIVRVETATINRGIYQSTVLFDPSSDSPPTPLSPPKGWNRRLIAIHGVGCPSGWYIQGAVQGVNPLDAARLGEGYALFTNTLNHPTNSCNAVLAGETTMMGKEHFIETFGVPSYTISTGRSGGAYTSLQVADEFPGLIDGVYIGATFPDALSIAMSGLDARLLNHYFTVTNPAALTDAQKLAITGYSTLKAFVDAANQAQRTDPVPNRADAEGYQSARWNDAVPAALRYDPVMNPKGARPTIFDAARNVYGVDARSGAALRPYDNVGVQYGLNALNSGAISPAQFLDLNEKIGGVDPDSNYISARTAGDPSAIRRTYQSGLMLGGSGGLASIPIVNNGTTNELAGYHYAWFHFALRDRLRQANGNSDNMVFWRNTTDGPAQALFDKWMVAYTSDHSSAPRLAKVLKAKPAGAVEGCYDKATPPQFLSENLVFTSKPISRCSELYPVYSNPRREAGGPLAANVLKCELKPVDARDYQVAFTGDELARLKKIFGQGVCDFSKPGINQVRVVPWASWGPSPKNRIAETTRVGSRE